MPFWRELLIYPPWKLEKLSASPIQVNQKSQHVQQKPHTGHHLTRLVKMKQLASAHGVNDVAVPHRCVYGSA